MRPARCALPDSGPAAARRHLERIAAEPRPAGSRAESAARSYCAGQLRALGFEVSEEPFEYSAVPGRLGTPLCGLASILLLAAAGHLGWRGHAIAALTLLIAGGAVVLGAAWWLARRGVLELPWWRQRATNLIATRQVNGMAPALWLVAHLDSKSQPIPIAVRALAITASLALWVIALLVSGLQSAGMPLASSWPVLAIAGVVAGIPVAASVVRSRSPGALDNASGVATVLLVAELLPDDQRIGVLLTSGEELGLAGARAWAAAADRAAGTAINIDGVDDVGHLRVIHPRPRPAALVDAVATAAREAGIAASCGPLPPGLLVDSVALADRGWTVITLSKGSWRTVARIHTPGDDLARLTGAGVAEVAGLVRRAVGELG
ncbi:MAG TPA: M28 family peptidase [Gemmatimonadaceae bacterium]